MKNHLLALLATVLAALAFPAWSLQAQSPLDGILPPPIQPADRSHVAQVPPMAPPGVPKGINDFIHFDGDQKEDVVRAGTPEAHFKFSLTNVSSDVVTVHSVATSCGCTTAKLPPMPWALAPGTNSEINVTMNLAGKSGTVFKTVTVSTDRGTKSLMVKSVILAAVATDDKMGQRDQNQKLALADRQAVFKGDCASCHVPASAKRGAELYAAACGICHEAEHRATMVPDLHALNVETGREFWQVWITYGKQGSLMPAFAQSEGGPLTDDQVSSLVDYLARNIPSKPVVKTTASAK